MPRVLIVEDEPEANRLLCMLLELKGCLTESAHDGAEALASVERDPPDLIFLDLMLPDVDGLELCRQLKSLGPTAKTPVVVVTARLSDENRAQSFAAGADHFISKPYLPDQIFHALETALEPYN